MAASTVGEALEAATDAIGASGSPTPRLDAEVLLAEASARSRAALVASPETALAPTAARTFGRLVRRRIVHEPVAYIIGRKGFRHIELEVDARVLVPRPETELLVELAVAEAPARVLDIGTGSGAVALAVAHELPGATVVATDTSLDALALAERNRDRLGLGERVELRLGSLAEGEFDLALANLPYVSEAEWAALEPDVREHEPRSALVAGPTGLEAIDAVLGALSARSEAELPRTLGLEVGAGQAAAIAELARRTGYEAIEVLRDLAGIERVVVGRLGG